MSGFTKTFESKETFKAYHLAEEFCQTNGISFGASCAVRVYIKPEFVHLLSSNE
jgi:hypothetical protein